ncbi:MAG TPA: MFS transporter [Verrucomicrobiota bacterium]|nr:MFS transporter [Verrucomicrobiales bacterium]HRI13636.1 MFS transporter [Verrucomicrobiota bacterium]
MIPTAAPPSPGSSPRYAWVVVGLLFPVALLNYLDRQLIAAMKVSVMRDISDIGLEANWGYMLGQFKWVYACLSPIGGYLADRFSRRLTICGSLFAWSAITWATGHMTTYHGLLWTRTLMGISEAFYIPAALALIADHHTGPTRSRAVGIHQMGIYCGVILGGFGGYAADAPNVGWRTAFNYTGLVGILYAVPLAFLLRDVVRPAVAAGGTTKPTPWSSMRELFTNGSFILLVLYFTLPGLAGWVVRDWMPAILQKSFNISQGVAGVSATLYWQSAAIVAAVGGGWLADRWMRRNERGRIFVSAIGMLCIIPALFGVGNSTGLNSFGLAIASLILFGWGWGFFDGNNMPILCQIVRPELRATGYGIMNFVAISCGGFADWGFGLMRDRGISINAIFGAFASLCVVSFVLVLLIRPREPSAS